MAKDRSAVRHSRSDGTAAASSRDGSIPLDSAWLRSLADFASFAILIYQDGRFVYANRAASELSGYSLDEMLTMHPIDLVTPEFRPVFLDRIERRLAGLFVPKDLEFALAPKGGGLRWLELQATLTEVGGRPAIFAIASDITDRRLAAEALAAREQHLWLAQKASRSVTWEWDPETDELRNSDLLAELFGIAPEDLGPTGDGFLSFIHPDDRAVLSGGIVRCLKGEGDLEAEIRFSYQGREMWLAERAIAVRDEATGRTKKLVGVASDVTERHRALVQLAEREEHYRQIFEKNLAVQWLVDPESGRILEANPAAAAFYGYSVAELATMTVSQITEVPSGLSPHELRRLERQAGSFLLQHRLQSGEVRDVEVQSSLMNLGERVVLYSIIHDVTDRRRFEQALSREKERAQVTLASIGDGVIRTDELGLIDYLNPVAERLTGWSQAEALGRKASEVLTVVDENTKRALPNPVERCLELGRMVELPSRSVLISRDGRECAIRDTAAPVRGADGRLVGAVVVFKDVTELLDMEREVSFLARHDPLTGLLNRREFEARLSARLDAPRPAGEIHVLAYLDLDDFKVVNDTCGHVAGDELLKQVAARLKSHCRGSDTLARLGGDEFAVLREGTSSADLAIFGDTLRRAVRGLRFSWNGQRFSVGASIGLVPLLPRGIRNLTEALSAADAACYVAKESGRNRVHVHHPEDNAVAARHGEMQWISRIHEAFAENRFVLYHQRIEPLRGAGKERPMAEIFLRMRSPDGSLISPGAFVPVAERYHLISAIDRWVVDNAFSALSRFRLEGGEPPYTFAINLSGATLSDPSFQHFVSELFARWEIPGDWICFEVTETAAVGNLALASEFIRQLKAIGCRFVLDDFGSGLSSFAYLKNLPVDFVKIDGEFVRGVRDQPVQRAIVEAIAHIAHVLGLATIGESVEDGATVEILRELGVDHAQGYWLALPAPLEECLGRTVGSRVGPPFAV